MMNAQTPRDAAAVTPSDTTELHGCGFYVGVGGNVAVVTEAGTSVTFVGVPNGGSVVLGITKIKATGTTATDIVLFKAS